MWIIMLKGNYFVRLDWYGSPICQHRISGLIRYAKLSDYKVGNHLRQDRDQHSGIDVE